MSDLTPYDTGQRCEAKPWIPYSVEVSSLTPAENFGKVDFDDECGDTIATVWLERADDGSYQLHVVNMIEPGELRVIIEQTGEFKPPTLSIGYREVLDWFHIETGMEFDEDDTKRLFDEFLQTGEFKFGARTDV